APADKPQVEMLTAVPEPAPAILSVLPAKPFSGHPDRSLIKSGLSGVGEFNKRLLETAKKGTAAGTGSAAKSVQIPAAPQMDIVGGGQDFFNDIDFPDPEDISTIHATCRYVSPDEVNGKTLNIWVADESWETGGTKNYRVTQEMVDAVAEHFLDETGSGNDIYNWVSNIYGEEWGPMIGSLADSFIPESDEITILMYDIQDDEDSFLMNGGIVGYFWSKDNYLNSALSAPPPPGYEQIPAFSNERIMFCLDASMLAAEDGPSWDLSDYWPQICISTLAHEFQHMINFYQKAIVATNGTYMSETWLDEMCSGTTEDFVARKIEVDGPRGVAFNEPGAGDPDNYYGRMPGYNYYNDASLTTWDNVNEGVEADYGGVYAFGAYLARNYGGAGLFREIVQNTGTTTDAVTSALETMGYLDEDFSSVFCKWAAANLLSDSTDAPEDYRYNTGTWFTSTLGSVSYDLGSINLFNYVYDTGSSAYTGPYLYTDPANIGRDERQGGTSNLYFRYGTNLTGTVETNIRFDNTDVLTIVIK
ncbi:MAG: hypothetical protein JW874_06180, partial [Spirochaetales bacterium]|nr:hypothetical protein [Spirochaetales bacterium]